MGKSKYNSEYEREKVECDICNKIMSRSSIYRHKQDVHLNPKKGKKERDYSKGKIYMVDSVDSSDVYIGSTTVPLHRRLTEHKSNNKCTAGAKQICDKYDNVRIVLIEEYPCKNNDELRQREQYYIDLFPCVNINKAYTSAEEYYERKKEYSKSDKMKAYSKSYRKKRNYITQPETVTV